MIGSTFSTASPGSSTSVKPGRSSPSAAMTVWCLPWMTWGWSPSAAICRAMCWICASVASGFMTTIMMVHLSSGSARLLFHSLRARPGGRQRHQQKSPGTSSAGSGAVGVCLKSREQSGKSLALGPGTGSDPGKCPGPPPATVKIRRHVLRCRALSHERQPLLIDPSASNRQEITRKSNQARYLLEPGPVKPNRKVMVKNAAARRATRRLPLGEPPLVITTHAITSFRSSHPDPAGVQPRAVSGPSPLCHGSTTRKSTERVFGSERHIEFSRQAILDQQATAAKKKRGHPPGTSRAHVLAVHLL